MTMGVGVLLGLAIAACGPSLEDGAGDDAALECEAGDEPVACVALDGEGCLREPAGMAACVDGRWSCEQGFTTPQVDADAACSTPPVDDCDGGQPWCTDQSASGECSDYVIAAAAFCMESEWACPPGFRFDEEVRCEWPEEEEDELACTSDDEFGPECYDHGPGDCSDTTQPANCTAGTWTCPQGWDFDSNQEDCDWGEEGGG
jgi:hypothetical protein